MKLKTYLNLYQLLEIDNSTKSQRRAFGLSNESLKNKPLKQLTLWTNENKHKLKTSFLSTKFLDYMRTVSFVLTILGFIGGFLAGLTLLNYNGQSPVNVIYFIAIAIVFPVLTMFIAFFSMLKARKASSMLVHLSSSYIMEKIVSFLIHKRENIENFRLNPLLNNWIIIKRSQSISLFFSVGLFSALLITVITKDIAFSWSTTLDIDPIEFHSFLSTLAFSWRSWFPSAVPSLELVYQSQYFRLGDSLNADMIANASKLGEWWKFLAFATFFYAIFLRFSMLFLSMLGWHFALNKSILSLDGVDELIRDMNEPSVSLNSKEKEVVYSASRVKSLKVVHTLDGHYDGVQGWAISKEQLYVLNDVMKVDTSFIYSVGGTNTLEEDMEIINKSNGKVLLYVKAWEPPTMDFMDYLEMLVKRAEKVIVVPVGTEVDMFKPKDKLVDVWIRKISLLPTNKVCLCRC